MSLINQMLRDLEQRRTAEAGVSPLGGLSASESSLSASQSINYLIIAAVLATLFAAGIVAAYFLGAQKTGVLLELRQDAPTMPQSGGSAGSISSPGVTSQSVTSESISSRVEATPAEPTQPAAAPQNFVAHSATIPQTIMPKPLTPKETPQRTSKANAMLVAAPEKETMLEEPTANGEGNSSVLIVEHQNNAAQMEGAVMEPSSQSAQATTVATAGNSAKQSVAEIKSESKDESINKTIRPLTAEQQSQLAFQSAVKLLGNGKQQAAQRSLEESLTFSPANVRARETLVALLLNAGRMSEAAGLLREGLRLMPGATPLAKLYARILVDQRDVPAAVSVLERALPSASSDVDYHALLAALYRQVGKHAQAAQAYRQILLVRPGVASWWLGLGLSLDAMGDYAQALAAFQRAQRAGGLGSEVLTYVQSRITALAPTQAVSSTASVAGSTDTDGFEE